MIPRGYWAYMQIRVKGISVQFGYLFALVVCFLLTCSDNTVVQFAVLFSLLHECGHLLSDCLFGEKPKEIRFGLFGMTILRADDLRLSYRQEICSALAGPFVNFLLLCLFLLWYHFSENETVLQCAAVNFYIFIFNAMPVFSLDGGRALEAFLKVHIQETERQICIEKAVSLCCISVVMGFGFIVLFQSGYNFTLLLISGYLIVTLFLKCGT